MKNMLIVCALIFTHWFELRAQSLDSSGFGMISYEQVLNFDSNPVSKKFNLIFSSDLSLFVETDLSSALGPVVKPSSEDEFDLSFSIELGGERYILLTDFDGDRIESQMTLLHKGKQKTYIVQEKISNIKWKIENEFRMMDKVKVQKATGEFRGRKYVAWFSSDIPVKYGPWKLNGLPGLIVSATDETNEVMFRATSIKVPFVVESSIKSEFNFSPDAEKISLARFRQIEAEQGAELSRLIASKLPRGAKIELKNPTVRAIELEYEE